MLEKIRSGKIPSPFRLFVYGQEKIGKSTFASRAPAPVFMCAENGTELLAIARLPEPKSYADIVAAIQALKAEKHSFQTLVLDTVDWLSPLVHAKVVAEAKPTKAGKAMNIEEVGGGFGTGARIAAMEWRKLLVLLDELRAARNMNVILLGHSHCKLFSNPCGQDFHQYAPKLSGPEAGILREWVDGYLFATYEIDTVSKGDKARSVVSGDRVLKTVYGAGYEAGNRYGLSADLPLSFSAFNAAIQEKESR